ncbi:aldehyde dehydrogenase family protein [Noviherbaspirillum sedimenti]|uniref:aldehyde dehydrogenase family protein n=1 Tax=Noviherbaspirillum sedimenti TaxID=2320865 RepID=UPI001F234090|nr:aldehyde dehydrogenase family protein [Noviherbaspirillum sedimenti]
MKYANKLLIDGELVGTAKGKTFDVEDPATGQVIAQAPAGDAEDIDRAVRAARHCFDSGAWTSYTAADRAATMWKLSDTVAANIDQLSELEVIDNGMPLVFARASLNSAINGLRYYAGMCTKLNGITSNISGGGRQMHAYTQRDPVGVVGAITPWNAPLATLINKIAPAIAAGCALVCKPAEQTPLTSLRFAELIAASGLPRGLINIVTGLGSVAGAAIANHPGVDKVTFTGSTEVGKGLVQAASGNLKRLTLELGGKSPVFLFDDADLERAIPACIMAIFANSGQVCFAGSRLYVQRRIFDEVVNRIAKAAKEMRLGSGLDAATQLGPLVSQKQMARVLSYIESGITEGAELLSGGARFGDKGYFVEPTVFANQNAQDIRIVREEIFGPVLVAMPFDNLDDVAHIANSSPYGLGAGIFSSNVSTVHKAAQIIRAGNIWINCYGILDKSMPFGGFRQSGWGREHGIEGIEPYLETKSVYTMLG